MTKDEAIDKVQKLLKLSKSNNANEAASAMKAAQTLITKYEINEALLDESEQDDEEIENFAKKGAPLDEASQFNLEVWRERIAILLSDMNHTRVYTDYNQFKRRKYIQIVGRPSDVEKVRYLFQYFTTEVNRLCERDGKGCGKIWRNNFRHGIVDTLENMLKDVVQNAVEEIKQEDTTANVTKALIRLNQKDDAVAKFVEETLKLKKRKTVFNNWDPGARELGRAAGQEIQMTQARGAIG